MFNEDIFCKYVILQSTYCIYISVQKVPLDYYMYIVHDIFVGKMHIFIKNGILRLFSIFEISNTILLRYYN